MQKIIHRERERGRTDLGWLQSRFSFSFSDWYEPSRMGFGRLRVVNDDVIAPLGKFGMHPHHDFEIITIPLVGTVTHEDSLGNVDEVHTGEAQAMSAGTGVVHSEFNASETEPLSLFQIWIEPNVQGAKPRYSKARFDSVGRRNSWQILISGGDVPGTLPVYQNARIARADIEANESLSYAMSHEETGAYIIVIEGRVEIEREHLLSRDAIGISETDTISIFTTSPSSLLLIEVPMR